MIIYCVAPGIYSRRHTTILLFEGGTYSSKNSVQYNMETTTTRNRIAKTPERHKTPARRQTATEIRRMPKTERNRIMNDQFRKAKEYYAENPGLVIEVQQDVIDY